MTLGTGFGQGVEDEEQEEEERGWDAGMKNSNRNRRGEQTQRKSEQQRPSFSSQTSDNDAQWTLSIKVLRDGSGCWAQPVRCSLHSSALGGDGE